LGTQSIVKFKPYSSTFHCCYRQELLHAYHFNMETFSASAKSFPVKHESTLTVVCVIFYFVCCFYFVLNSDVFCTHFLNQFYSQLWSLWLQTYICFDVCIMFYYLLVSCSIICWILVPFTYRPKKHFCITQFFQIIIIILLVLQNLFKFYTCFRK